MGGGLTSRLVNGFWYAGASCVCLVRGHHWATSHPQAGMVDEVCTRCYRRRSVW